MAGSKKREKHVERSSDPRHLSRARGHYHSLLPNYAENMMTVPPHHHGGPAGEEGQDEAAAAVERRAEDGAERVARAERGVHQRVHAARAAGEAARENISDAQKIIVRYATLREAARAWRSRAWPRPPPPAAAACRPSPGSSPTTDQFTRAVNEHSRI